MIRLAHALCVDFDFHRNRRVAHALDLRKEAQQIAHLHRLLKDKLVHRHGSDPPLGDIFGGWVMAQVDLAGSVIPARIAKGRIATVAVNQFIFKQPVKVGDLLSFYSEVERVGNTSITVKVEVYAQRMRQPDQTIKVTEANLTYVAIDDQGHPRTLPKPGA